jgi:FkbM family methyltransferase
MSTTYFILSKPKTSEDITDKSQNQILYLNNNFNFILPQNLMTCYIENGLFESNLMEWCKQFCNPNKIFLDIGSHTGTYGISLSKYCKHVYCFEPQKMTYYSLCGSVALSNIINITCLNFGLGSNEQSGKNILKIVSNDGGGSTLHSNNMNVLKEEEIEIKTLDSLNITNIGFIKMDVEDNELFVLKGSIETLKQSNYPIILFESNYNNTELFDYIKYIGYNVIQIQGVTNMFLATR